MKDKSWKNNNLLLDESISTIDGIKIKIGDIVSPTAKYVQGRYKIFNKKYFNNQLPDISSFRTKIVESNWYAGMTLARRYSDSAEFFELRISRYTQFDEKTICETILHEMIHIYQICILKMVSMPHTESFIDKMNEINKYGWNIPVTLDTQNMDVYSSIKKSIGKRVLVVIYGKTLNSNKGAFITYRDQTDYHNLDNYFYKYDVYNIKNNDILKKYYFISNIDDFNNPGFKVHIIKDEDINSMIKNNDIEMASLKEFLIKDLDDSVEKKGYDNYNNYYYQSKTLKDNDGREYQIIGVE